MSNNDANNFEDLPAGDGVVVSDGITTTVIDSDSVSGLDGGSMKPTTDLSQVRSGSSPNFCPPIQEGMVVSLQDDRGDVIDLEFLGLILDDERSYGFFFPLEDAKPLESGEVVVLQVNSVDENGQPTDFEMIGDETEAMRIFEIFKEATKDIYTFE